MVATGGEDGAIKIWDIYSMRNSKLSVDGNKNIMSSIRLPLPHGNVPVLAQAEEGGKLTKA